MHIYNIKNSFFLDMCAKTCYYQTTQEIIISSPFIGFKLELGH
jgi:hypothetical protein